MRKDSSITRGILLAELSKHGFDITKLKNTTIEKMFKEANLSNKDATPDELEDATSKALKYIEEKLTIDCGIEVPTIELVGKPRNPAEIMELIGVNLHCAVALIDEFLDLRKYDDEDTWYHRNLLTNMATRFNNRLMVINGIIWKNEFEIMEKRNLKTLDSLIEQKEREDARQNG